MTSAAGHAEPAVPAQAARDRERWLELARLSERSAAGDPVAFAAWVESTTPAVYRLVFRILGSQADANDAVQEAYLRAWREMDQLRDHSASLAWICRVARNAAIDLGRKRKSSRVETLDGFAVSGRFPIAELLVAEQPSPEQVLASNEARAFVRAAIASLPEKHRLVLLLREVDGMTYEELAAAIDKPRGTIESRLHRARNALRRKLRALARQGSRR